MNHSNCTHPATKAARAQCRKDRAAHLTDRRAALDALIDSYYHGGDLEEIAGMASIIAPEVKGYYDGTLPAEDFIAALSGYRSRL